MNKLKILSLSFGCFISAISYTNASTSSTRKWTSEEDERLVYFVRVFGERWDTAAAQMPDRTQRQCRERWNNYLSSSNSVWTPKEDDLLVQKVKELGSNWPRIASYFVNRSPTTCKNRWTANERHSREQQSQSSSLWRKIYNWFFPGKPELRKKDPDALGRRLGELNERLDPQGLKVDWDVGSAFREDLCAYSALLAAREIRFITGEEGIQHVFITRSKVREFALDLRARLEAYGILIDAPLDMDHLEAIAQHLGIFIILEVGTPYETYSHYTREFNPNAPIIVRIFLFADQNFGHYQIITPQNIEMHYENDCPGDIGGVFTHCPDSLTVPMTSMTTDDIDDIFAQLD